MPRRAVLRRWSLAAASAVLLALAPAVASAQFTSLTFFGDSFTDTGNGDLLSGAFGLDFTPSPPYAAGRASNGPLWADYLAAALGLGGDANPSFAPAPFTGRNFAVGTARTGLFGGTFPPPVGTPAIGMLAQFAAYPAAITDPTGLYAIFGGANDIADAAALATEAERTAALAEAAANVAALVTGLHGLGARTFLVPFVPDVGRTPQALATPFAPLLSSLTDEFNGLLAGQLAALDAGLSGSTILGLHLDTLFDNILFDAQHGARRYGLTNTTVPCFAPGAPSCGVSVFVDEEHATTRAHELIAAAAVRRIALGADVQAVPEPATVVLVGGGLAVLALGARRRARRG
jgi:phospholipase/lecithinase/hemolysin